jgi:uncharacterized membrane protein YtjA (UPF0391 family)
MLYSTFGFPVPLVNNLAFIIALIAEAFGAGGVAGETSWIAHVLLVMAVIFIIISFVGGRRGPPAD